MSTAPTRAAWRRLEHAQPLVAWRREQLADAGRALQEARDAWRSGWGFPAQDAGVACLPASGDDLQGIPWRLLAAADGAAAWMALPLSHEEDIAEALWGRNGQRAGPVAARVTRACAVDLQARLRAALRLDARPAGGTHRPPCSSAWSGAVDVTLGDGVRLLLDAAAVGRLLRTAAPGGVETGSRRTGLQALVPAVAAIAARPVPLRAALADCELALATLQDLRIGDIVPVPHRLDEPLQVRDARGLVLFAGHLARRGTRKVLELAAPAAAGKTSH